MVDGQDSIEPAFLAADLGDFWFASVGMDVSGWQVVVGSTLARVDLEPCTEATSLALPPACSVRSLHPTAQAPMAPRGMWSVPFVMRRLDWASNSCLSIPPRSENELRTTFHPSPHGYAETDPGGRLHC